MDSFNAELCTDAIATKPRIGDFVSEILAGVRLGELEVLRSLKVNEK